MDTHNKRTQTRTHTHKVIERVSKCEGLSRTENRRVKLISLLSVYLNIT